MLKQKKKKCSVLITSHPIILKDNNVALQPLWPAKFAQIAFLGLETVNVTIGIWKLYLWCVICCQAQLQCVATAAGLLPEATPDPPTSDQASVYANVCAASHSASHTIFHAACREDYIAELTNYCTAFHYTAGLGLS